MVDAGGAETARTAGKGSGPLLVGGFFVLFAGAIAWLVLSLRASPTWQVLPSSSTGLVLVDGVAYDAMDRARLGDWLQTAKELDAQDAQLSLMLREHMLCEVAPGTKLARMKLPPAGEQSLRLERGTLHVAVGPRFGSLLRIYTDDAVVEAREGAFVVSAGPDGTRIGVSAAGAAHGASVQQDAARAAGHASVVPLGAGRAVLRGKDGRVEEGALPELDARILRQLETAAFERWSSGT